MVGLCGWLVRAFHFHEWVVIQQGPIVDSRGANVGQYFTSKCRVCGKHRTENCR